ncbi:helix-turn-helix transcriptional regulator [Nonomuraea sp. NPDC049784]|uniref:helix-turn-helix transcriptional regulator n=1 Tax=Nonomuraea sp. NPDC049784 TaxID=3154361 RepID=UPI0033C04051
MAPISGKEETALSLYRALRAQARAAVHQAADAAGLDEAEAERGLRRLRELGLVDERSGQVEAVDPEKALQRMMESYRLRTAEQSRTAVSLQRIVHALTTVYSEAATNDTSLVEVEIFSGRRKKDRTFYNLHTLVTDSCDSIHPGPMPPKQVLDKSLRVDARLVASGVRCRAIYPQSLLKSRRLSRYLHDLARIGVEVRLIDHAPIDMVILDRLVAVLPSESGTSSGPDMVVIRGSALIHTQVAIYDDYWLRAVPYEQALAASMDRGLAPQEQLIIRLLADGLNDDQIARKVGVHRRTVQRAVTKLMDRLGASNRFQAGLKLARGSRTTRVVPGPESLTSRSAGPGVLHVDSGEACAPSGSCPRSAGGASTSWSPHGRGSPDERTAPAASE